MIGSLGILFLTGLLFSWLAKKCRLPGLVGMLLAGVVCGPCGFNLLDESLLSISSDLRKIALIIILIRAGLTLNLKDLKKVGRPAVLLSFLPASFEILGYVVAAPFLFHLSIPEAALTGAVLAAVSPAVVVPRMVKLMEEGYGTEEGIPQMLMAGSSCDDIFVIVLFTTFLNILSGGSASIMDFVNIPISIVSGILIGGLTGKVLQILFGRSSSNSSIRTVILLGCAFVLTAMENVLKPYFAMSGLLAVIAMACMVKGREQASVQDVSSHFGRLWSGAEILLFVLTGAAVDVTYLVKAGIPAIVLMFIALGFRCIGVALCVSHTHLKWKERVFCLMSYLPKATVQAAIGSVPLAAGLACGQTVLSIAVMGIVITAPLGAFLMDRYHTRFLSRA